MGPLSRFLYEKNNLLRNHGPVDFFCKFIANPRSLIHVGAHLAEEKDFYTSIGIDSIFWIESNPIVFEELIKKVGPENCALGTVWSEEGVSLQFKVSNNSVSSSVYDFDAKNPWIDLEMITEIAMRSTTLDKIAHTSSIFSKSYDKCLLVIDIQGAELPALMGATRVLDMTSAVVCEISKKNTYVGGTDYKSLDLFLRLKGFRRMGQWIDFKNGHGDALYVKKNVPVSRSAIIKAKLTWLSNYLDFAFRVLDRKGLMRF
jgi:FkbM family methyltransferase